MTPPVQTYNYDVRKSLSKNLFRGFWRMMTGFRKFYFLAVIMLAISALMNTSSFLLVGHFVDSILPSLDVGRLAPFVGLGWLLLGTVPQNTFALGEPDTLAILTAPFTGLAQIMLLDQPMAGALIALGLWLANRRAAGWALIGASVGVLLALWLDEPAGALLGLHSYNPALAAMALSQMRRQPWLPLLGILLAILLTPGFAALHLPALTAPFILACWLVRAGVRVLQKPRMDSPFESP